MDDDAQLLRRFVSEKSDEAFGALVSRHVGLVYHTALRCSGGDAHRAEDVSQMVFVLLAQKASALTRHASLAGWLHLTTHHVAGNVMREERRRLAREQEAVFMNDVLNGSESSAEWERVRPVFDEVLLKLGDKDREAVLLRFFQGRTFAEVGEVLAINEDAARMRVGRALEKLRGLLARRGVTSTAGALGVMLSAQGTIAAPAGLAASITGAALSGSATVVAATAAVAGAVTFMSTTKIAIIAATVVMAAVSVGVYVQTRAWDAEEALAAAQREHAAFLAQVRDAEQRAREAKQQEATARAKLDAARKSPPAPDLVAVGDAFMAAHPEVKDLVIALFRPIVARQYYGLYREMHWSDEQIAEFEEIMLAGQAGNFINMKLKLPDLQTGERERRLQALLGEDAMKKFHESNYAVWSGPVQGTAAALFDTDSPLTAEQSKQLGALIEASKRSGDAWQGVVDLDDVVDKAGGFMSELQVDALRNMNAQNKWRAVMRDALTKANAAPNTGKDSK